MRLYRFTFLCSKDEKDLLAEVAICLQRSQSDAIRCILIEKATQLQVAGMSTAISQLEHIAKTPSIIPNNPNTKEL